MTQQNATPQTQAILEALRRRAARSGDPFDMQSDRVDVRCFNPTDHQNGDAHPSATYTLGKYLFCKVCNFKLGEVKLADRLGIGSIEGGLTLTQLADAKLIPEEFLAVYGWRTQRAKSGSAGVYIPWYDLEGVQRRSPAYHVRHYVNKGDSQGPRFTWDKPKGTQITPYGAWRNSEWADETATQDIVPFIVLCESELDTVTMWLHGLPANAWGGADFWRKDWVQFYAGFERILVCAEADLAGARSAVTVGRDLHKALPDLEVGLLMFPDETKDANAVHLDVDGDTGRFRERFKELVAVTVPVSDILAREEVEEQRRSDEERRRDIEVAQEILHDPALFHRAITTTQDMGVAGEGRTIGLVRLSVRSRALQRPVNLEVNSPSSAGKTHIITTALQLEDPSAYYELTGTSEKALIYTDEPLAHRIVFIQEPEGLAQGVGAAVMKLLSWEGRLRYDTVIKVGGRLTGQHIEKDGPTGLIVSTTRLLDEQLSNRLLRAEVDTSQAQTEQILQLLGKQASDPSPGVDLVPWHALSRVLGEPAEVTVGFAGWLAERLTTPTLRIRRDFTHLLTLIKASALEHRFQRNTTADGVVIATVADYAVVQALVADLFSAAQAEGVTREDRRMVQVVSELTHNGPVSQASLANHTGLSKSSVHYRVKRLLSMGYLTNQEDKRGRPHKLVLGAPLPGEPQPLPSPCELSRHLLDVGLEVLVQPWTDPITGRTHDCHEHPKNPNTGPVAALTRGAESSVGRLNTPRTAPPDEEQFDEGSAEGANGEQPMMTGQTPDRSGVRAVSPEDGEWEEEL